MRAETVGMMWLFRYYLAVNREQLKDLITRGGSGNADATNMLKADPFYWCSDADAATAAAGDAAAVDDRIC